jgi:hypothetical protein
VVTAGELKSGSEPIGLSTETCIALFQAIVQSDFWPKEGHLQPSELTVGLRLQPSGIIPGSGGHAQKRFM